MRPLFCGRSKIENTRSLCKLIGGARRKKKHVKRKQKMIVFIVKCKQNWSKIQLKLKRR